MHYTLQLTTLISRSFQSPNEHILLGGFRVRYIKLKGINGEEDKIIYTEKNKGPASEIPWFLFANKESDENVVDYMTEKMEEETLICQDPNQPLSTTILGKNVTFTCQLKHSQWDRSLIEKISGNGGAICKMFGLCLWIFNLSGKFSVRHAQSKVVKVKKSGLFLLGLKYNLRTCFESKKVLPKSCPELSNQLLSFSACQIY